ncbi:MAG TPA: SDR family oxidoreductase [Noviherbaspirillum sp.]|nr:SDR family oxidoreductase [Noviherbaspirillum sp.]
MSRLKGKRILITGGTSGIGLETARQFLLEGARVIVTGRNEKTIASAREALGNDAAIVQADAGNVAEQAVIAEAVRERFGQLDAAFLNAGIGDFRPLGQWDETGFDRLFAVNLKGPFFLMQALSPLLANPASVIFNASVIAHLGMPNASVYAATKAGLISLARSLSSELVPNGVRINVISPGPVTTPIYGKLGLTEEQLQQMADTFKAQIPVGRFGDPVEIAKAAVFLASDESSFMVGGEMVLDGGFGTL